MVVGFTCSEVRRAPLNKWHFLTLSADLKALCASA
jgi:hypothetical protein